MTTQPRRLRTLGDAAADALPRSWQRLLALSGVAFALLFVVGWFTTGGVTPHYNAPDQDWTNWAHDNQWNGRISAFPDAARRLRLPRTSWRRFGACSGARSPRFAGLDNSPASCSGVADRHGRNGDGVRHACRCEFQRCRRGSRGEQGGGHGFGRAFPGRRDGVCRLPDGRAVLTLRTGVFARWTGIVALVGAVSFLITFLTVLDGTTDGSPFGYGFFPGVVALVTWTIATSIARYRGLAT